MPPGTLSTSICTRGVTSEVPPHQLPSWLSAKTPFQMDSCLSLSPPDCLLSAWHTLQVFLVTLAPIAVMESFQGYLFEVPPPIRLKFHRGVPDFVVHSFPVTSNRPDAW